VGLAEWETTIGSKGFNQAKFLKRVIGQKKGNLNLVFILIQAKENSKGLM